VIITIAGQAGSGKSTVARILAARLNLRHYSMGDMRRKMAEARGMTLAQLNKVGETNDFTDREVDEFQARLGREEDDFVVDGRTSWYFVPHSLKVYLEADISRRADRVFHDERATERFASLEEAQQALEQRESSDRARYRKYYGIDVHDRAHFDIVMDTSTLAPEEVAARIVGTLRGGTGPAGRAGTSAGPRDAAGDA